uniref:Uncharacterized protein n=1 Tax=Arion vulgaris TaxID=1028688 RepID=A0A0B7BCJ4_9EUPU
MDESDTDVQLIQDLREKNDDTSTSTYLTRSYVELRLSMDGDNATTPQPGRNGHREVTKAEQYQYLTI